MNDRLAVLLPSDVFPPRCGGAGWSAHTLARALLERDHAVTAIVPRRSTTNPQAWLHPSSFTPHSSEAVLGVPTVRVDYWAPNLPFIQNYFRHERFWPRFADAIIQTAPRDRARLLIHAQHVQAAPAAILAGRRLGAPVVITVRDHWPWDYFSTGLHANRLPYPRQTLASLATDLVGRLGPARGALALPAIPYMLAHLRRRQLALRQADAVIAVSDYIAQRLAPLVAPERLHVIPNMVDLHAIDAALATHQTTLPPGTPYLMFVGKLERNKGAHLLIEIFRELKKQQSTTDPSTSSGQVDRRPTTGDSRSYDRPPISDGNSAVVGGRWSVVIAGDGPLRPELERELAALHVHVRCLDWIQHDEVLRLIAGCELLLFPSAWGEPLSRVPIEAGACGAAVLAMPTGGTPSIITDGVDGALEASVPAFARRLATLLADPAERRALGVHARQNIERRFAKQVLLRQFEQLYRDLIRPGAAGPARSPDPRRYESRSQ